jgi:RNA-binding protein
LSDRESKQAMIDKIVDITQANLVQVIGNVMVIYRAFDEDPQIILPRK